GPLPQTSGDLTVAGLDAQVEILRDASGVPHIYASSPHDLFFAQGFTQAQDRWWQMEFNRHIGRGAIGELTGKNDSALGNDMFIRTAGWYENAQLDLAALDDSSRAALTAFTDGVNAYISGRSPDDLAMEYRLLGVTGVNISIEPWTPLDTLVWGKVMAWNLTDTWYNEIERAALLDTAGEAMTTDYVPPFPYDDADKPEILADSDLPLSDASLSASASAEIVSAPVSPRMAGGVTGALAYVGSSAGTDPGIGSNNWVATGTMTESGKPLLANDPHLGIQMPSVWYEIGLHCLPVTADCAYDVTGMTFPSIPGVVSGHNARIAWGVTNVGADVQDLYRITVNPDNPLQYQWNGEWRDMTVRDETIHFGGGEAPITMHVRITHLGSIINDNDLGDDGQPTGFNSTDPMALRWTGSDANTLLQSALMLDLAQSWDDFREALRYWDVPSQNFVYADVDGNIGYQTPGDIAIRAVDHSGLVPVDGSTDAYEWKGYIPFDSLPRVFNPARNYIATANQAVTPLAYYDQLAADLGEDANYLLSYDWSFGYRAQRINQLLNELAPLSPDDYVTIQGDNLDINAQEIMPALLALSLDDPALADMRDWLGTSDFQATMDSPQAALWAYFASHLLDNVFSDQLPPESTVSSHNLFAVVQMLDDPQNVWWDDAATPDVVETRDDMLTPSLAEAIASTEAQLGADRSTWTWGALHTASFINNPLGLSGISLIEDLVNRGPVAVSGGPEIINATSYSALNALENGVFNVGGHPSMRTIIDLSDWDNSRSILATGQSGHPFSPHYSDQIEPWRTIQYHPMLFTRSAVEAGAIDRLVLSPGS
ncbi:MAG TPA: penicillin acylase family protein, partial [Candidatus Limnocylindrales bacterium]|nr:penicillin acylase family protein [Candidatus Limnocylindrales bacterium]